MLKIIKRIREKGVSLRGLNRLSGTLAVVLTILMVISIVQTVNRFETLRTVSDRHTVLRIGSYELQIASDYLTEQARCFAVCGEREHLDNYFEEAEVTRRRDRALEVLQAELGDTKPYQALQKAMNQSLNLMDTEYYSMRLAIEGRGEDLSTYPEIIQKLELSEEDRNLSSEAKQEKARSMVFDDNYHNQKKIISENMQACLLDLDQIMEEQEIRADRDMTRILWQMGIVMGALIFCFLFSIYMNNRLLIRPLLHAVDKIQNNSLLSDEGAHEFRYLARTYNQVYGDNQEQAQKLAYEASHDKLTGLSNRNSFDMVMDTISILDYALLIIDVDFFKKINDNLGHHVGDQALCTVGQIIRKSFREKDYVFRIGGDEFAVILQHINPTLKSTISNKIEMINKKLEGLENEKMRTTVSAGVTFHTGNIGPEMLYRQADRALYKAKNDGRRSCAFYGE